MGPPQVDGGIGPLGLVGPWYRVLRKTKNKTFRVKKNVKIIGKRDSQEVCESCAIS